MYAAAVSKRDLVPAFLLTLVLAVCASLPLFLDGLSLGSLQLLVFPFVFWFMTRISVFSVRVPGTVLVLALLGMLSARSISSLHLNNGYSSLVVTTLQGDQLQSETRIFREGINAALSRLARAYPGTAQLKVKQRDANLTSYREAAAMLESSANSAMVAYGGGRWIQVALGRYLRLFPESGAVGSWLRYLKLEPVRHVAMFGLSLEPLNETAGFLAAIYHALVAKVDSSRDSTGQSYELTLRYAAAHQALWSSNAHRAYPSWILGNYYLGRFFESGGEEPGELDCAISSYDTALRFLRPGDNSDLFAAALNNKAVALAGKAAFHNKKKNKARMQKALRVAIKARRQRNTLGVPQTAVKTAKYNLRSVKAKGRTRKGKGRKWRSSKR
ncbi:MAG: hypothetical protein DCC75_01595 [Proteobacteria bacterium]|nr:MAG: hypothetical protein DCC75_01595 [Pseudomonadota bacterium]